MDCATVIASKLAPTRNATFNTLKDIDPCVSFSVSCLRPALFVAANLRNHALIKIRDAVL
jgi:hypothetical protein